MEPGSGKNLLRYSQKGFNKPKFSVSGKKAIQTAWC